MPARPLQPIVVWFGRVGDMILLTALLAALHRRYGAPCHVIGAGSWPQQIYAHHPDVARVSSLRRYTAFLFDGDWWRLLRALRADRTSPVYVCETDRRKLRRIRRLLRLGGVAADRCVFMPAQATPEHWVDRLLALGQRTPDSVRETDYPCAAAAAPTAPCLRASPAAIAQCDAWLRQRGWHGRPLVLVQPGNRRTMRGRKLRLEAEDDKSWPVARWVELLRGLQRRMPEAMLLLCGAPRETLLLDEITRSAASPATVASVAPDLPGLFALCERAHSMISVDTGPAHAAAALSLPLVVLFGAQPQSLWLPRSPGAPVVGIGGPPQLARLDEIQVGQVLEAWDAMRTRALSPVTAAAANAL